MDLLVSAYAFSEQFPPDERYALTQQMRRAALSVPPDIAEGRGRATRRDFRHFCVEARGSLYEMETIAEAAGRLGYVEAVRVSELINKIAEAIRPLNGLIQKLSE